MKKSPPQEQIIADLTGKVVIITGTTSGIGLEMAYALAQLGAHVVMHGRSVDRCETARENLIARGVPAARLRAVAADLSRPAQVAALARELAEQYPKVDVLINNAGCYPANLVITPDGIEECWATNVLAYEVFTTLLRPSLESARGRLIYVSSSMSGDLELDDLLWQRRRWSGIKAYSQSKKADTMLAWAWQRRLADAGVAVNVAHPDGTATNIAGRQKGAWGFLARFVFSTQRRPQDGADVAVWLAADPAMAERSGGFYLRREVVPGQYQDDIGTSEELWHLTQQQIAQYVTGANVSS